MQIRTKKLPTNTKSSAIKNLKLKMGVKVPCFSWSKMQTMFQLRNYYWKENSRKVTAKTSDTIFTTRTYHLRRKGNKAERNLYNHVILTAWNSSASIDQVARNGRWGREWVAIYLTHEQLRVYSYHWVKWVTYVNQLK